jgi:hypothetical protein
VERTIYLDRYTSASHTWHGSKDTLEHLELSRGGDRIEILAE